MCCISYFLCSMSISLFNALHYFALSPGVIHCAVSKKKKSVVSQIMHSFFDVNLKLQIFVVLLGEFVFFDSLNASLTPIAKKINAA